MPGSVAAEPELATRNPPGSVGAGARRLAALFVALGGLALLYGSFDVWDTCPKIPCEGIGGLLALFGRTGVEIGPGVVTAELGFLLAVTGLTAIRRHGTSPFRIEAIALALLALLAVAAYLVRTYGVPEFFAYGPDLGVYIVAGGAAVAAVASWRLRPPDRATRAWALAQRPALVLLIAGVAAWSLTMSGHLGVRIEPLTYALVLGALGVGLWPGRLPGTRLTPTTMAVLIVLYGALSFAGIVFGDLGLGLLQGAPVAVLIAFAVLAVLELPIEAPQVGAAAGRIDAAMAAIRSTTGLMIAALLLTGAAVVLLIARLVPAWSVALRLALTDGPPPEPAQTALLLVAGLAIEGGLAIAVARRAKQARASQMA
jgi:hypothetical protein